MQRFCLLGLFSFLTASPLLAEVYPLTLYRSYGDMQATPALLIGKINTKGRDNTVPPRQILGYDARMAMVSASIDGAAKIYPGMKVYIIKRERDHIKNKAALIVAEGEIDSISDTVFSGRVAQIRGQFSMASRQHFIAIPSPGTSRDGDSRDANAYLIEAERHRHEKDYARSAQKLQHARELEPGNPLVNLRYAQLAVHNGAHQQAHSALKRAFEERRRLEDINDYLSLGTLYLGAEVRDLPPKTSDMLKAATQLLARMRQFEKDLGQYGKDLTPPKSAKFRLRISRFSPEYHLQFGVLLRAIAGGLREYSPQAISQVLNYAERDALYAPIETKVARNRVLALPRKQWDRAYTDAAITHFEIALKKDRHNEAAFEIVDLCDSQWEFADGNRRQYLKEIVAKYAPQYLERAHDDHRMSRVRNVLNKINQA
jgi:hypothetical protein